MKSLSRAIAVMSAMICFGKPALPGPTLHADVTDYAKVGRWSVTYATVADLYACSARTVFQDETAIEIGLIESNTSVNWVVFFSNERWNTWIGKKARIPLQIATTKSWHQILASDGQKLILGDAPIEFIDSIGHARSLVISDDSDRRLAVLEMEDSAAAIRTVVKCVREHAPPGVLGEVRI